jgi:hypothetical protein
MNTVRAAPARVMPLATEVSEFKISFVDDEVAV